MKTRVIQFIPFLIATTLTLISCVKVFIDNLQERNANTTHGIPAPVVYGVIALTVIGLSIPLRRNIWKYLFLIVVVISFFQYLRFSHLGFAIYIGSLKIDLIAIPILISHIVINIDAFKARERTNEDIEQSRADKINFFIKKFENKSAEELESLNEKYLEPEAQVAKRIVLDRKSL